ncbi:type II toxin-antitoxin system HicB family antitoxin [Priestia megaterium]|uniref:type II toxin-antitoxin system HicB family antitoxin n=1 Tax=Priestia megaterium TaxID=1404 RepID=UPI0034596533
MAVHRFYCVIHKETTEGENGYIVTFPDLENVFTQGDDLKEAIEMAEDVLSLMLMHSEDCNDPIPSPSPAKNVVVPEGASLVLIEANTDKYREACRKNVVSE